MTIPIVLVAVISASPDFSLVALLRGHSPQRGRGAAGSVRSLTEPWPRCRISRGRSHAPARSLQHAAGLQRHQWTRLPRPPGPPREAAPPGDTRAPGRRRGDLSPRRTSQHRLDQCRWVRVRGAAVTVRELVQRTRSSSARSTSRWTRPRSPSPSSSSDSCGRRCHPKSLPVGRPCGGVLRLAGFRSRNTRGRPRSRGPCPARHTFTSPGHARTWIEVPPRGTSGPRRTDSERHAHRNLLRDLRAVRELAQRYPRGRPPLRDSVLLFPERGTRFSSTITTPWLSTHRAEGRAVLSAHPVAFLWVIGRLATSSSRSPRTISSPCAAISGHHGRRTHSRWRAPSGSSMPGTMLLEHWRSRRRMLRILWSAHGCAQRGLDIDAAFEPFLPEAESSSWEASRRRRGVTLNDDGRADVDVVRGSGGRLEDWSRATDGTSRVRVHAVEGLRDLPRVWIAASSSWRRLSGAAIRAVPEAAATAATLEPALVSAHSAGRRG